MATFPFDPRRRTIEVLALASDGRVKRLSLLLDTAATRSSIACDVALELGFDLDVSPHQSLADTAAGSVSVPLVALPWLRSLGREETNFEVACINIPPTAGVDGVLGFDFLHRFHIFINYIKGLLVIQQAQGFLSRLRFSLEVACSL